MKDLEEVLKELKAAEKEYAKKCKEYGIIDSTSKQSKQDCSDSEESN